MKLINVYGIKKIDKHMFEVNEGSDPPIILDRIIKVSIRTTEQGPFLEDVFLTIYDEDDNIFNVEQQAPFYNVLYGFVSVLKYFDFEMVIKAMQCTDNNEFVCWEKGNE